MTKQLSECGKSMARQCAFCSTPAMITSASPKSQALTMCRADLLLARSNERATPCHRWPPRPATARELRHKSLKRIAKLIRIEIAKQPAEGVVTGKTVGQGEKAAQKWLLGLGKHGHIYRALAAAQHAA